MACKVTHPAAALTLLAALPVLASCAASEPRAAGAPDHLPSFGWPPPRMRAPSTERPAWLPPLPADLPRFPAPRDGFQA